MLTSVTPVSQPGWYAGHRVRHPGWRHRPFGCTSRASRNTRSNGRPAPAAACSPGTPVEPEEVLRLDRGIVNLAADSDGTI
jgi:hypothetical protein